jgi:hypothetical protein
MRHIIDINVTVAYCCKEYSIMARLGSSEITDSLVVLEKVDRGPKSCGIMGI